VGVGVGGFLVDSRGHETLDISWKCRSVVENDGCNMRLARLGVPCKWRFPRRRVAHTLLPATGRTYVVLVAAAGRTGGPSGTEGPNKSLLSRINCK